MQDETPNITQLLIAWGSGDPGAHEALAQCVQQQLRRLASYYMAGERRGHVLQPTALVNEAYLRLVDWQHVEWKSRAHFFGVAAQMMRRVLLDVARSRGRAKRAGQGLEVSLSEAVNAVQAQTVDVIALDAALRTLEQLEPRQCRVIELRFFAGLSLEETAEALGVSIATVRRDWSLARAWLFRELNR